MKSKPKSIYSQLLRLSGITKTLLLQGNITRAKHCLQAAEDLFNRGNIQMKNAISGIYISSVSAFMEQHSFSIKVLFPKALQTEYSKQIDTI